jgi:hypothetical protein
MVMTVSVFLVLPGIMFTILYVMGVGLIAVSYRPL